MAPMTDQHRTHQTHEAGSPAFVESKPSNLGVLVHVDEIACSRSLALSVEALPSSEGLPAVRLAAIIAASSCPAHRV